MNKVYCNKDTDIVEQIINIDVDTNWSEDWFSNCYVIDDPENKINTYNMKYNKEKEIFEVVEGLEEKDEIIIAESEIEVLKKENEDLKTRLERLENSLNKVIERSKLNG